MRYKLPLALALGMLPPALWAQQDEQTQPVGKTGSNSSVEVLTGVDYEQRELDTGAKVERVTAPVGVRAARGRFTVTAQVPYVRVSAPGNVVFPSGPLGLPVLLDPGRPSTAQVREGLGDARLDASYQLPTRGLAVALRAGVKLPTASTSKGLGTGKSDYSAGADLAKTVGRVTPFASVTYTVTGNPENVTLKNTLAGQAGAAVHVGTASSAHLGVSYTESSSAAIRDEQRVFGGLNTPLAKSLSVGAYGSAAVDSHPNVSGGLTLGLKLH